MALLDVRTETRPSFAVRKRTVSEFNAEGAPIFDR